MQDIRLTPGGTCDRCGSTGETAKIETATFGIVSGQILSLCKECAKEIVERFRKGDQHYG